VHTGPRPSTPPVSPTRKVTRSGVPESCTPPSSTDWFTLWLVALGRPG